jgi:hypothetical protein
MAVAATFCYKKSRSYPWLQHLQNFSELSSEPYPDIMNVTLGHGFFHSLLQSPGSA